MSKILLVEDDKLLGEAIVQTLTDEGYELFWSRTADEAFEALDMQEINMIYLDIMLPGEVDGYEILRRLKNEDRWKTIPVIMLTNLGQMSEIDRAMELGASDYFIKANIDLEKLVELTKARAV